ncbi:hypothetical protein [Hymenobacter metallicola]|uniref:DUF5689 domain-containing protein n=1 Tax=Hymenobacter metallicola TaxID=2563114 RepID=A0A4Z0QIW1_9BACT|nr:hypothetical protein [Hymenobacter metallicola]TGE29203.1 hypothetical protein E5K02_07050 [Hymenobacter metallicola]
MKKLLLASLLAFGGLLPACQFDPGVVICDDGSTGPTPTAPANLQQLYSQLGAPVQTFTYDPSRANTFTGAKGTVISIPANAFVKNGRVVSGPVQLSFREIFKRADMVLSSMPTVSGGRLLESAGEVYLRADQDSSITLATGATIRLQTQTPPNVASPDSMRLFVGGGGGGSGAPACFDWTLNNPSSGATIAPTPTGNVITVSSLLYNSGIGWLNCDKFYSSPNPRTAITVKVTGGDIDPIKNTMVFAVFRTFNGSLRICSFKAPDTFEAPGVPEGLAVSVVVIRTLNGKLYYGRQDGTIQAGVPFAPVLKETTSAAMVDDLNQL